MLIALSSPHQKKTTPGLFSCSVKGIKAIILKRKALYPQRIMINVSTSFINWPDSEKNARIRVSRLQMSLYMELF